MAWPSPRVAPVCVQGFLLHPSSSSVQSKCFPPPSHGASIAQRRYCSQRLRGPGLPTTHTVQSLSAQAPRGSLSPKSVVQVMPFSAVERIKTTCTQASTQRPRRTKTAPPGRGLWEQAKTSRFCPSPEWTFCSLPLRLLLEEIVIFLLLQLTVILLDFPVGFFHVVIHELVHEWVKISLVTKKVDKLGAVIKVACR